MRKLPGRDESAATLFMAASSLRQACERATVVVKGALKFYKSLDDEDLREALEALHRSFIILDSIPSCTNNMIRCASALDGAERKAKRGVPLSQTVISSEVQ